MEIHYIPFLCGRNVGVEVLSATHRRQQVSTSVALTQKWRVKPTKSHRMKRRPSIAQAIATKKWSAQKLSETSLAFAIISMYASSMPHVCLMYALLSQRSFVHLCVHHTDQHQAAWTATSQPSLVCEEVDAEGGNSDACGLDTFDTTELSGVHAALREETKTAWLSL